ncbi:MAG: hypothetical protein E7360_01885 [Clostridiales bacterium]|nr:hypothetical protein [Clostridiales bacterium]
MFDFIGEKLRFIAVISGVIFSFFALVIGIFLLRESQIIIGLFTIVMGVIFAWFEITVMFAYAKIVENLNQIVVMLNKVEKKIK